MASSAALLVLCLCAVGAGCHAPAATDAAGVCPDPACAAATVHAAAERRAALEKERAAFAEIRGPGSISVETDGDRPARGRMESYEHSTFVEVRAVEVAPATKSHPGLLRFAMRLCEEDGTTHGTDLRSSRRPEGRYYAAPEGWTDCAVAGEPFHRYYSCPGGTAWEVDGIADVLDGGRVRFHLLGKWIACTK
jgi:hypothetical protein